MVTQKMNWGSFQRKSMAVALAAALAAPTQAGQLDDALNGMFTATTSPQTFSTASMHGVAFGNASLRWPVRNYNIISFDPPRLNAGCSGIDMYMGSFGFISSDQLKQMFRSIAAAAPGFAFKMAIDSICSKCGSVLTEMQRLTSKINEIGRNTCKMGAMLAGLVPNPLAKSGEAKLLDGIVDAAAKTVNGWWDSLNKLEAGSQKLSNKPNTPAKGNLVWRAFFTSGTEGRFGAPWAAATTTMPGELAEIAINMVGTEIVKTDGNSNDTCTAADGTGSACEEKPWLRWGVYGVDDLVNGAGTTEGNRPKRTYYVCNDKDTEMSCQNMVPGSFTFKGTHFAVNKLLFGEWGTSNNPSEDSIAYKLLYQGGSGLTDEQRAFLSNASSYNLARYIYRTQRYPGARELILEFASLYVASEAAARMTLEIIRNTEEAFTGKDINKPVQIQTRISELDRQARTMLDKDLKEKLKRIQEIEGLIKGMEGPAFGTAGLPFTPR